MKRFVYAMLAAIALVLGAAGTADAQIRVSVDFGYGPRWGHSYRVYRPSAYYHGSAYHGRYSRPEVVLVRSYRPRPVVVVRDRYYGRDRYHRGYRGRW